ncbi:MAG: tetratricopeptide repeat protein, partial [Methanosarcina mazei]|nr:tetratricopeptide repeat protein [Methanosarcina mazei]
NNAALECFNKTVQLKPDCITAWYNKGYLANVLGDVNESINSYESALEIDPDSPSALYNKRFSHYRIKEYDEASVCKAKLDSLDPGFEAALQNRGTRIFIPQTYRGNLDYPLPLRWYGGEDNVSLNTSTNMTPVSQELNNTSSEPEEEYEETYESYTESGEEGYWYIPEPDEDQNNKSPENRGQKKENDADNWYVPEPDEI